MFETAYTKDQAPAPRKTNAAIFKKRNDVTLFGGGIRGKGWFNA
jgi:hypothetical protein